MIQGGGDYTWAEAVLQGWCYGSGTLIEPYIIEYVIIHGLNSSTCIEIRNSNVYFIISNSIFEYSGSGIFSAGIKLVNVSNGILTNINSSRNNNNGILLIDCLFITIENSDINYNGIAGISLINSHNNYIVNNTDTINYNKIYGIKLNSSLNNLISGNAISHTIYGIFLYRSNHTTVSQNIFVSNKEVNIIQEESDEGTNTFENNEDQTPSSGFQFPMEMVILIISIGAVVTLGITGASVWKKKISVKGMKEKDKVGVKKDKKVNKVKSKLQKQFSHVDELIRDKQNELVMKNINEIMGLAKENKFLDVFYKAEEKMQEYINSRLEEVSKIKNTVLNIGTKYTRLQIMNIIEESGIYDENLIISTIEGMIANKEIYGKYFASSNAIEFDQQANIEDIDKLMEKHKEWEDKNLGKAVLSIPEEGLEKYSIFLSYSTLDSDYFEIPRIVSSLEEYPEIEKVRYWEADSKQNIVEFMDETLQKSNVFVLFCSERSMKSGAVKDEWQAAFQRRKKELLKLIPVYEQEEHIPAIMGHLLNVKFEKSDFDSFIEKLHQEILR